MSESKMLFGLMSVWRRSYTQDGTVPEQTGRISQVSLALPNFGE